MRKLWITLIAALLLVGGWELNATGDTPCDGITVNNADNVRCLTSTSDSGLAGYINNIFSRLSIDYSDGSQEYALIDPGTPFALLSRLGIHYSDGSQEYALIDPGTPFEILSRLGIHYSDSSQEYALTNPGTTFEVLSRIAAHYADSNRQFDLIYPKDLINDITPPQISNIMVNFSTSGQTTITWMTDELANNTLKYGLTSSNYPNTASTALYTNTHQVLLNGLTEGATYYFVVSNTDLSGNTATSAEQNFKQTILTTSSTITGQITDSNNTPIPSVTISTNGGPSTTTSADGSYTLSNLADGMYTLTPAKSGYSFAPVSRTVTVPPDQSSQNFTAIADTGGSSTIAGKITDSNNNSIAGVTISTNGGASTITGATGAYTLSNLADGAYTLTPSKLNYTFSPVSLTVTIPPDKTGQNFIAVAKDELVCSVETALDLLGISSASDTVEAFDTPAELLTLYTRIRDEVFNPSSTGQQFVDLFYENTTELSIILLNNPDLRSRTAQFLQNASEEFASLLPDATTTVPLTQNLYNEADALVRDLAAAGSPEFKTEMLEAWADLALDERVGEDAGYIWISMQPNSVYLPVVIK